MGYAVRISRITLDDQHAVYEWQSTAGHSDYVLLDVSDQVVRPCDSDGNPIGAMLLRIGDDDVASPVPETVQDFLTVAAGIIRRWNRDGPPPVAAHLYFG